MSGRYTLSDFVEQTKQEDLGQGLFELENERLLEINLNGLVWMKKGAMVAYHGEVKFTREGMLEHGLGKLLKKAVSGEGTQLTKAEGRGKVYLADTGKKITVLQLEGDAIFVNGNDLLAFEPQIKWDIKMMKKITGLVAGGLFNVRLEGTGLIAITTHYDPVTLRDAEPADHDRPERHGRLVGRPDAGSEDRHVAEDVFRSGERRIDPDEVSGRWLRGRAAV